MQILADKNIPLSKMDLAELSKIKNVYRCIQELKSLGAIKEDDNGNIRLQSQLFRTSILFDVVVRKFMNTSAQDKSTETQEQNR